MISFSLTKMGHKNCYFIALLVATQAKPITATIPQQSDKKTRNVAIVSHKCRLCNMATLGAINTFSFPVQFFSCFDNILTHCVTLLVIAQLEFSVNFGA